MTGLPLRALTLHAQYAAAIMAGTKRTETRTWAPPPDLGRVWVHAGLEPSDGAYPELPRGVLLGHVAVTGATRRGRVWLWQLADPQPLPEPVPARGLPRLWPVPPEVLAQVPDDFAGTT